MRVMKEALESSNLNPYLICQPLALLTPDIDTKKGYLHLPENFLGKIGFVAYIELDYFSPLSNKHLLRTVNTVLIVSPTLGN